jgi:hypothetical protein
VEAPDATGSKPVGQKQSNSKQINIGDNQQPSGDKREHSTWDLDICINPA